MKTRMVSAAVVIVALASKVYSMPVDTISAEALSNSSVKVTWSQVADTSYYDLYQDSGRIASGIVATEYDVADLNASTFYQFFVTACGADGACSIASQQADVTTSAPEDGPDAVCPPATDGSAPVVMYTENADGTARLSWCEVTGAEGYNLFVNNNYVHTYAADVLSANIEFDANNTYQVAWFAGDNYPAKSAPATDSNGRDPDPDTGDRNVLAQLDAESAVIPDSVEIYFTRHAEKIRQLEEQADGSFTEVCGEKKCAEVLNAKGELRAELLARLFSDAGVTTRLTHAFSSHKIRTRQTIEAIAMEAGLSGDNDKNAGDGIQEFPISNTDGSADATELDPESTSPSEAPVINALLNLPADSVALVAGHSGTLYDIMTGIGLTDVCTENTVDICNQDRYPVNSKFKVRDFGDIWKVVLVDGGARFIYRANFQPQALELQTLAR